MMDLFKLVLKLVLLSHLLIQVKAEFCQYINLRHVPVLSVVSSRHENVRKSTQQLFDSSYIE